MTGLHAMSGPRKGTCQRVGPVFTFMATGMDQSKKPLLFVVDDEPLLLELAAALLEPAGYEVKTFRDPDAALQAFASAKPRPALIITDYAVNPQIALHE